MSELNLFQRIHAVMAKIEYIQKDSNISGSGASYKAVSHDNVVAQVRAHLIDAGIVIYPEQLQSEVLVKRDVAANVKMMLYSGDYAIHFVNADKPDDRISVTVNAHANDNGDKAPGKALSYAVKSAILKVFLIETGENDESRVEEFKPVTELQAKTISDMIDGDRLEGFLGFYGIEEVAELPKKQYNEALVNIRKGNKNASDT